MIKLKPVFTLNKPFISAASGLLRLDGQFYVVADDENYVGIFDENSHMGKATQVLHHHLPDNAKERKKVKADFESLTYLPDQKSILVVPSGSTTQRMTGVLLNDQGEFIQSISFQKLYEVLLKEFPELNIEGAAVRGNELWLWQRGNGSLGKNAIIRLELSAFFKDLINILAIHHYDLGKHGHVSLSFTDGCITDDGVYFLAVAEETTSTYLDGTVSGSYLGFMSYSGDLIAMEELELRSKPEGLCLDAESFYIVTDDDDRNRPAVLYRGKLPAAWRSLLVM